MNPILSKYNLTPLNICEIQLERFAMLSATPQSLNLADFVQQRPVPTIDNNNVGHLWIQGFLGTGLSKIEKLLGGTDYTDILDEVDQLLNKEVSALMMHIDSGGGSAMGNTETSQTIRAMLDGIPSATWNHGLMASAAYNLAVATDMIGSSESAQSGSIGTIIPFIDKSGAWQAYGLDWQPITNKEADLKGAGMGPSLTEGQREHLQEIAQDSFELFKSNVLANRLVDPSAMRGQTLMGNKAKQANLIDFVGNYNEFYQQLTK